MKRSNTVENFMTRDVVCVEPETPLVYAVEKIISNNFNGLPVVGKNGNLLGILTEMDLMIKGSSLHLPTLLKLLDNFKIYSQDKKFIKNELKSIVALKVKDVMNSNPLVLKKTASVRKAIDTFCKNKDVNPIPIVDEKKKLVGIISRFDIITLFGQSGSSSPEKIRERRMDKRVNQFLSSFEKNFLFVRKARTNYWLIISLAFLIIGFVAAFLIIVRIDIR